MDLGTLLPLVIATLLGAFAQSVTGFGFALVAAPTFLAAIGSADAIAVLGGVQLTHSMLVVPSVWRSAPRSLLLRLMAGGIIGVPIGLVVLSRLDLPTLQLLVGLSMMAFVVLLVVQEAGGPTSGSLGGFADVASRPSVVGVAGFASGLMTAVLVMPGPPVLLLVATLALAKRESRALALTFFGFCFAAGLLLQAATGRMTAQTWWWIGLLVPAVALGAYLGNRAAHQLSERWFRICVLAVAAASGFYAVASTLPTL
jgi:uncharacterized membrane protein YfcA